MHSATEARPLISTRSHRYLLREIGGFYKAVDNSGPSPGGGGHRPKSFQTLEGNKHFGPSPGVGNPQTLGEMKKSGPSPGVGHHKLVTGNNK